MPLALGKRIYLLLALVAVLALAATAVTASSRLTSGDSHPAAAQSLEEQGDSEEAEEQQAGVLDDGEELLPQAGISLEQAIAAARSAASGSLGEVDLEYYQGKLVFNVDIGDKDVKVDASSGEVLSANATD
ncbi:MAG TPA: PepSY domain-containing protein [Dehalococcoidia bacterium]|nr:PepSY domain-containing protein [Dehalococcoidia bacterium]